MSVAMTTAQSPLDEQIEHANATGRTAVVFIHGLWLLAGSWDRWADLFAEAGYAPRQPGLAG
jgi:pimeloyl-ACP methyl ester carboxylesterase